MGYLVVTRKEGEKINISIDPGVDTQRLLEHLLRDGITVHVGGFHAGQVKIAIDAPKEMLVLRHELVTP